jgi:hypothetical protein
MIMAVHHVVFCFAKPVLKQSRDMILLSMDRYTLFASLLTSSCPAHVCACHRKTHLLRMPASYVFHAYEHA